jgi:hypothetical protein
MTDPETVRRRRVLVESHLLNEHLIAIGNVALRSAMLDTMYASVEQPGPEMALAQKNLGSPSLKQSCAPARGAFACGTAPPDRRVLLQE